MSEKSNFFAMLSRMKYVNRWGLMRNLHNESIAEHTMDVVFLAHALVVIANTYFGECLDEGRVVLLAAFHDAPEIMTGDMPTPVKYFDPEIRNAYGRVEEAVIDKMVRSLPEDLQMSYESLFYGYEDDDDELFKYVKAADKLSALIKCIEEEKMGNSDFKTAKESTLRILQELNMQEVNYFMDTFLAGYDLTLDEQTAEEPHEEHCGCGCGHDDCGCEDEIDEELAEELAHKQLLRDIFGAAADEEPPITLKPYDFDAEDEYDDRDTGSAEEEWDEDEDAEWDDDDDYEFDEEDYIDEEAFARFCEQYMGDEFFSFPKLEKRKQKHDDGCDCGHDHHHHHDDDCGCGHHN